MTFPEAVASGLTRFVRWEGRASRSEYWWFGLFNLALGAACGVADRVVGTQLLFVALVWLAMLLPNLSMLVRRLHDTGRGGAHVWFLLVPVVGPVLVLLWTVTVGHPGPNRFGPPALGRHASHGAERRFLPPPIYRDAPGYRPSDVPRPRTRPGYGGQDADPAGEPQLPPFAR